MNIHLRDYVRLLAAYLGPQWPWVALLSGLLLGSIGLQLLNPQLLRRFIDTAVAGPGAGEALATTALLFIGVALLDRALAVAATYVGEGVAWTATNALRTDVAAHCLRLDLSFHKARTPGELIERIDGDVTALATFFSQFVIRVVGNGLLLAGVLVLLWREDARIGLALTLFAGLALVVLVRLRALAVPHFDADREASAGFFGFLGEHLSGTEDTRAAGATNYVMRRFYERLRGWWPIRRRANLFGFSTWMASLGLFAAGHAVALGLSAWLFGAGAITIGTVYLIFHYTESLREPLEGIRTMLQDLQRASASIGRVEALLRTPSRLPEGAGAPLPPGPLAVEFQAVAFGYEAGEPVLRDVSFRLAPGRVLGLLGRTGSGKTTLARLLPRLYDPTAGAVCLGGVPLPAARLADVRRRVGMVTQDVQLFNASVRDNLTFFDPAIPDARIEAVLGELGLGAWLAALPAGLATELAAGGGGLSAGEAQLLALARVFLKDPGLVVLDEASARLDPATEALIEQALDRLLRDRTAIIIAHRLRTVGRADEIMILEDGRILEHGERAALAAAPDARFHALLRVGLEEVLA